MIIDFLINFLTRPFLEFTKDHLKQLFYFYHPFFLFRSPLLITFLSKIFILLVLGGVVFLVGFLTKLFFFDLFLRIGNFFLHKLPFINKIYKTSQDVIQSLFSSSKKFSQVVFVPFPTMNSLTLGFVSNENIKLKSPPSEKSLEESKKEFREELEGESDHLISVFIPGTPNPSVGFMLMFKKEQLHFLSIKVDEAMKFIVSCGIVMPHFEIIQPPETHNK